MNKNRKITKIKADDPLYEKSLLTQDDFNLFVDNLEEVINKSLKLGTK